MTFPDLDSLGGIVGLTALVFVVGVLVILVFAKD
jgi:hypothetical protein